MKKSLLLTRKIVMVTSLILSGFLLTGTVIANENATAINQALGIETSYVAGGGSGEDTEYFKSDYDNLSDLIEHTKEMCEAVEAEGAVLLKNEDNALPLAEGERNVSLFGVTSADPVYGGTGSGSIGESDCDFVNAFKDAGFNLNPVLEEAYAGEWNTDPYVRKTASGHIGEVPWETVQAKASSSYSEYSDAAIFIVGRQCGEGKDCKNYGDDAIDNNDGLGNDYLGLNANELSVLKGLSNLRDVGVFKRLIVIINSASQIECDFLKSSEYSVDAALWIGTTGKYGNAAVAKILNGEVNPSGRMTDTIWMNNAMNPVNVNYGYWEYDGYEQYITNSHVGGINAPEPSLTCYVVYQEGMYLGYKYTETRYEDYVMGAENVGDYNYDEVVAYPFGYGLSYSEFTYSDFVAERTEQGTYNVSIKVTNSGEVAGKHSLAIYLSKPYGDYAKENNVQVPSVELIEFGKTKNLAPGESETLSVELNERYFASYDSYGAKTYVVMPGTYYLTVSGSAHDAVNNVLAAKGWSPENSDGRMDAAGAASLTASFELELDDESYSVSDTVSSLDGETYQEIANLFDFADINLYSGHGNNSVEYYSRSNWLDVSLDMTNGHAKLSMTEQMAREIYAQTPDSLNEEVPAKYSQPLPQDDVEYPVYGNNQGISLIHMLRDEDGNEISYFDEKWDIFMDQLTFEETATLVYRGYHMTSAVTSVNKPETNDENGPNGFNMRYNTNKAGLFYRTELAAGHVDANGRLTAEADPAGREICMGYPANGVFGATFNKELVYEAGKAIGEEGIWAGLSGIYGVGNNIHRSPYCGRAVEYYSEDGMLTGLIAAYECKGIEEKGVHVYNKHCALNDQEACRHGVGVWVNEQALRETYLRAFELPIKLGGAYNVMASFTRFGTIACPANGVLGTDYLRGECGMKGIIVTDMYTDMDGSQGNNPYYEHSYGVYMGGCDIPDGDKPYKNGDYKKYESGYGEMAWAMRESAKRVLYQTLHSNAMNGISMTSYVVETTAWWQNALIAADVVFCVLFVAGFGWLLVEYVIRFAKKRN